MASRNEYDEHPGEAGERECAQHQGGDPQRLRGEPDGLAAARRTRSSALASNASRSTTDHRGRRGLVPGKSGVETTGEVVACGMLLAGAADTRSRAASGSPRCRPCPRCRRRCALACFLPAAFLPLPGPAETSFFLAERTLGSCSRTPMPRARITPDSTKSAAATPATTIPSQTTGENTSFAAQLTMSSTIPAISFRVPVSQAATGSSAQATPRIPAASAAIAPGDPGIARRRGWSG